MKIWNLLFVIIICTPLQAKKTNQYFHQSEFAVDFTITHPIISGGFINHSGNELLIIGVKNDNSVKIAALFSLDENSKRYSKMVEIELPPSVIAFDLITDAFGMEKVLLLDSKGLSFINFKTAGIDFLTKTKSLYLESRPQFISRKKLIRDLNDDGLDDIFISNFNDITILLQAGNGEFTKKILPVKPIIDMNNQDISFSETRLFNIDSNFDNKTDILVLQDKQLQIYHQLKSGDFNSIKNIISLPMQVSAQPWWMIRGADGKSVDQSKLQHQMLETIEDINGDGIVDMMIRRTNSSGVLDRQNSYDIYYGINQNGQLGFVSKPNTMISAEGTLSGLQLLDLNSDNRKEILVSSFDIGITQIIGALLSGSIDQDVFIFSLDDNDQFNKEPLFSKQVDLNFSLSSGQTGQPVILLADLDGDGNKELLLSANKKRLSIYSAENNTKLFKSSSKKHQLELPKDGSMLTSIDLNNSNKQNIIVRYGKQDEAKLRNKVIVLSGK
ncbi:MAG: VCBS repeat-containing protein [Gammaproteobacteria bacterium]|nr:VCBS repeat-containing protein [Gammaproteobacteria bacterium]